MESYKFTFLLLQFVALADNPKYDSITFDEVFRHADAGTVPSFLKDRFGDELDTSIFEASDWLELSEEWASFANAFDTERKAGVYRRGVALLMVYALESLQIRLRRPE